MYEQVLRRAQPAIIKAVLPIAAALAWVGPAAEFTAAGFTPESPVVKEAVARGVEFLKANGGRDDRLGAKALVGMVMLKTEGGRTDPSVGRAVEAIQAKLASGDASQISLVASEAIYSAGLAAIFLIELDPEKYKSEIQLLLDYLQLRQKPHGGWGYAHEETGDTSMTQYAVLCSWEAEQVGFDVPIESIEKVAIWLLRTQDPSGGFGYKGRVSATFAPIPQREIRLSMSAAGLGSVYICSDLLGLATRVEKPDDQLPPALKKVEQRPAKGSARAKTELDPRLFRAVQVRGLDWLRQNYRIDPDRYTHYYMYALERCMSFRELCEKGPGRKKEADGPAWYNDGVQYLLQTQTPEGTWDSKTNCGEVVDTAFGILFLVRSTRKSIAKVRGFGDGTLIGGRGLPKDTDEAQVGASGKVTVRPLLGPAEQLLAMLDNDAEVPDYQEVIDLLAELPPEHGERVMQKHADKLRRLAGDRSAAARTVAIRAMAKTRNIDNVPTLIYALTDPDPQVVTDARDALRRISRRPKGFGLADRPSDSDRRDAIDEWKAWYRAVRPNAEFADAEFEN